MPSVAAAQPSPIVSNRPYHRGSRLHELFEMGELPQNYAHLRAGDVADISDDFLTATILAACPHTRVKFLMAIYDESFVDNAVRIAYDVIARSPSTFGKVIDWRTVAARERVNLIVMGVRAALNTVNRSHPHIGA